MTHAGTPIAEATQVRATQAPAAWARITRRPLFLLLLFMLAILVAPRFAPYDIRGNPELSGHNRQPPSAAHVMGTDATDRDLFSLVLKGSQTSLIIAGGAMTLAMLCGIIVGSIAAFAGGWVDTVLMRVTDISLSIPRFLVLLAITALSTQGLTLAQTIIVIGLTGWFDIARIVRGEVSALLTRDWVLSSRATGVGQLRLATRHIFPHLVPILVVVMTLGIGHTIVLEAGLMYLGSGTGGTSLGSLLREGSGIMTTTWWLVFFPGVAIALMVLACNALGDALRDVFAPEQVHAWPTT